MGNVGGLHPAQNHQRAAWHAHVDQRVLRAEAETPHRGQLDVSALLADSLGEGVIDALGAVARAARAHAHADARPRGEQFRHAGFAHRIGGAEILNAGHFFFSFVLVRCSTSRCSVCSFMCPKIAWSTSTTGASAHWPKQATVRKEYLRSGVVMQSLSAPSSLSSGSPSSKRRRCSRLRDPRVWHAVPRQMQMVWSPCGSRSKARKRSPRNTAARAGHPSWTPRIPGFPTKGIYSDDV